MYSLIVTRIAREDALDAFQYYESKLPGLGNDFLDELEDRYKAIIANPHAFSYTDGRCILRDVVLHRFPFVVIYKLEGDAIIVVSVHNCYKKPYSF